jgi:hypothetical protein
MKDFANGVGSRTMVARAFRATGSRALPCPVFASQSNSRSRSTSLVKVRINVKIKSKSKASDRSVRPTRAASKVGGVAEMGLMLGWWVWLV